MEKPEGSRHHQEFYLKSILPDFCKTADGKVVGYEIIAKLDDAQITASTVHFKSEPAFTLVSFIPTCTGDEAGTGGGVKSGTFGKICSPIENFKCKVVRAEGHYVIPQNALFWMNGAAPGGGNTIGKLFWSGPSGGNGSEDSAQKKDPPVKAETPKEQGFLNKLGQKLSSPDGIVDLAQKAYALSKTDWNNPGSVLGALGGLAGFAGLDKAAEVAGISQKVYQLGTTDWSNPGALLGAAANIAGLSMLASEQFGTVAAVVANLAKSGQTAFNIHEAAEESAKIHTNSDLFIKTIDSRSKSIGSSISTRPQTADEVARGLSLKLWQSGNNVLGRENIVTPLNAQDIVMRDTNPGIRPETLLEFKFIKTIPNGR